MVDRHAADRPIEPVQALPGATRGKGSNSLFIPLASMGRVLEIAFGSDPCPETAHNAQKRLLRTGIVIGFPTNDITSITAIPATGMAETLAPLPARSALMNPCPTKVATISATGRPSI